MKKEKKRGKKFPVVLRPAFFAQQCADTLLHNIIENLLRANTLLHTLIAIGGAQLRGEKKAAVL